MNLGESEVATCGDVRGFFALFLIQVWIMYPFQCSDLNRVDGQQSHGNNGSTVNSRTPSRIRESRYTAVEVKKARKQAAQAMARNKKRKAVRTTAVDANHRKVLHLNKDSIEQVIEAVSETSTCS